MDNITVIVINLFALVLIVALLAFRNRVRGTIKGPLKTELRNVSVSIQRTPRRTTTRRARSHGGSILADDMTGRDASVRRAEAQQDIKATGSRAVVDSGLIDRASVVRAVRGKYAHLRISSEEFAAQKQEEVSLEDRR